MERTKKLKGFDKHGRELPDGRPMEVPAGMKKPESMHDLVRRLVRTQVSQFAEQQGRETFQDANDFDVEDEEHYTSPYEEIEMQPEVMRERVERDSERGASRPVRSGEDGDSHSGKRSAKSRGHQVDAFDAQSRAGAGREQEGRERDRVPRGGSDERPRKAGKTVKR